jgi:phage terminase large subunit-like protein
MPKHPAIAYQHGVLDGSIPAGKLIRQAVERHVRDLAEGPSRGLRFDRAAAEHVIQFFGFLKHSKGEWAGQSFELAPWQQFILWVLFGWKRADGLRRFRTSYIELPRKNGKSTFAAGIGLYLLVGDAEPGAEVYSAATKRDQAKIVHSEATRMVKASASLSKMVRVYKDNLNIPETASKYEPLGADEDTLDGLNVHGAIVDEVHAHKTRGVVDVLDTATGARRQPLIFEITTAGHDQTSVCFEHHTYTTQLLEGSVADDAWFGFIATIDDGDRWDDPTTWAKANPNFGVSVKPDDLQRKCDKARQMPAAQNAFLRLHLDVWTQQVTRWIDLDLWDENAGEVDLESLAGRTCYGGLDLASVSDLAAWSLVFPRDEDPDQVDILSRFWCPEARLTAKDNRYQSQYQAWARDGLLLTTPGNAVDYAFIKQQILEDASTYNLVDLNVDRLFQGMQTSLELQDEGLEVFGMGQGFLSMAAPMKEFERRMLGRKLHHGGNPILRWMAGNVAVRHDPADNLKPDKEASQAKIDGIVALVMALDRAMRRQAKKRSVYEDHGLLST